MNAASRLVLAVLSVVLLTGCGVFTNHSRAFQPRQLERDEGWIAVRDVTFVNQETPTQCGYAVSAMTRGYWDQRPVSIAEVERVMPKASTRGITAAMMRAYFRSEGFSAFVIKGRVQDLVHELSNGRPVIVGTVYREKDHFIAHYEVVSGINLRTEQVVTLDPRYGWRVSSMTDFFRSWALAKHVTLVVSSRGFVAGSEKRSPAEKPVSAAR